jgi:hypothetical protein
VRDSESGIYSNAASADLPDGWSVVANATFVTNTASVNMLILSQLSINSIARKHWAYGLQCALKLIEESHIVLEI